MTKKELAICLGYSEPKISYYFDLATPSHKGLQEKKGHYSKMKAINYTLDECLYAMSFLPCWNPMIKQYLIENFIDREGTCYDRTQEKNKLKKDALDFIFLYTHKKNTLKVCNCCSYCVPKQMNIVGVTKDSPFCNFYGVFLKKVKFNVYKHSCKTFVESKELPRIWEYPKNMNIYGEVDNKILGLEPGEYISKRDDDEPIYLVTDPY